MNKPNLPETDIAKMFVAQYRTPQKVFFHYRLLIAKDVDEANRMAEALEWDMSQEVNVEYPDCDRWILENVFRPNNDILECLALTPDKITEWLGETFEKQREMVE